MSNNFMMVAWFFLVVGWITWGVAMVVSRRRLPDQFRLDGSRIVSIDGNDFIIMDWHSDTSYAEFTRGKMYEITIRFKRYVEPPHG